LLKFAVDRVGMVAAVNLGVAPTLRRPMSVHVLEELPAV
jgi:hypothetical protein